MAQDKPNIPVIRGDDIGRSNISAYSMGLMGTSNTYSDWVINRIYFLVPAQQYVAKFLSTFREFPPRQKAASFSLDQVMEKMAAPVGD